MISSKSLEKSIDLVRSAFKEYYFKNTDLIDIPECIQEREFGYMQFGSGMIRHLSFKTRGELLATLIREVPSDVYSSNAYYMYPSYPIQEKTWKGADLIFDIDAKDLHLPCEITHSYSICLNCARVLKINSESCASCNTKTIRKTSLPCSKCIYGLKNELKRLVSLLIDDFGIEEKNIIIYFSGNNGFHVHILDNIFRLLDSQARSEVVGYVMGNDLLLESIGVRKASNGAYSIRLSKSRLIYGWRKRIADRLKIDDMSLDRLGNLIKRSGGYDGFKLEVLHMANEMGAKIDPQVTSDVHRVFRLGGTLNSKSGLAKMKCVNLESFEPLTDACLLGDKEVNLEIKAPHIKLRLKGQYFNIKKPIEKLPTYAAVYLICKGLANAN